MPKPFNPGRTSTKGRRRHFLSTLAASLALATLGTLGEARADSWPSKPVTVISPYNPGGTNDIVARLLADKLSQKLGQPFVVQNRPGAGGSIGVTATIRAEPDGYTLLLANNGALIVQSVMREPSPYDPAKELTAIAKAADSQMYMGISTTVPATTVPEFLAYAKANPGQLNYSSAGVGSFGSLLAEALNLNANIDIVHVPSNGSAAALTELMAGRVHMMMDPVVLNQREGDRVRVLATTGSSRIPAYPDIPTLEEAGGPALDITGWFGLLGPADLPEGVVEKLEASVAEILQTSEAQNILANAGVVPVFLDSESFQQLIAGDQERYREIKDRANLVIE
ncbi:MAG: tripartite tricarboxylate transporter substrate binding protein [Pigmentiphaga sp.]|nr:tripartite tricarboxylate transporter substrate binding protein [Pigmentiphaga sp.]